MNKIKLYFLYFKIVYSAFAVHSWIYQALFIWSFVVWAGVFGYEHYHMHHGVIFSSAIASLLGGLSGIPGAIIGFRELADPDHWDKLNKSIDRAFKEEKL